MLFEAIRSAPSERRTTWGSSSLNADPLSPPLPNRHVSVRLPPPLAPAMCRTRLFTFFTWALGN